MGIPVDGSKQKVEFALRQKGFRRDAAVSERMVGSFNGRRSYVFIHTNHQKVDRIMVVDIQPSAAKNAKEYFNILLNQLEDRVEYFKLLGEPIRDDEDIEYEMTVNNKAYDASYAYFSEQDFKAAVEDVTTEVFEEKLSGKHAGVDMESLAEKRVIKRVLDKTRGQLSFSLLRHQSGRFSVAIYYDNLTNRPHGEDL